MAPDGTLYISALEYVYVSTNNGSHWTRPTPTVYNAGGHIARPHGKVDTQRFQNPSPDAVLKRVVAEQTQVARTAAGRDAGQDRDAQSAYALPYTGVQVRGAC